MLSHTRIAGLKLLWGSYDYISNVILKPRVYSSQVDYTKQINVSHGCQWGRLVKKINGGRYTRDTYMVISLPLTLLLRPRARRDASFIV